ncbi:hypothetical protein [Flavobacterium sp.]|uniref:hypothetical protein n=1 Tax=Flavobacterium sp. TaxID=239 RepID=UPI0037BFFA32
MKKLSDIIIESKKFNYETIRDENGEMIFFNYDGINDFLFITKKIQPDDLNVEFIGYITKKYYFNSETIEEAIVWRIDTEIHTTPFAKISEEAIKSKYSHIKNNILNNYRKKDYSLVNKINKFNFESFNNIKYDIIESSKFKRLCENLFENCLYEFNFNIGDTFVKRNNLLFYHLFFSVVDFDIEQLSYGINKKIEKINENYETLKFNIGGIDIRNINQYDIKSFINVFINDCKNNKIKIQKDMIIKANFEPLEGNIIALAYGLGDDSKVIIKVDPLKWKESSIEKKWYIIYHELGHDILNLNHGEAGKMMFNFADKEYSWKDFLEDKEYMFNNLNK